MSAVFCATVHDPVTMKLEMIVLPDFDSQLDDPSYNPVGKVHTRHLMSHVQAHGYAAMKQSIPGLVTP